MSEHKIGELVKTAMWYGVIVDVGHPDYFANIKEYKVHFFFPDNRLPTRWCSDGEIRKWKRNIELGI